MFALVAEAIGKLLPVEKIRYIAFSHVEADACAATAVTGSDILGPSEAFRSPMDYYAHAPHTGTVPERLARERPQVLACMHGSAWRGDGAAMLRALAQALGARTVAAAA